MRSKIMLTDTIYDISEQANSLFMDNLLTIKLVFFIIHIFYAHTHTFRLCYNKTSIRILCISYLIQSQSMLVLLLDVSQKSLKLIGNSLLILALVTQIHCTILSSSNYILN